jgi:hypothetical protein
MPARLVISMLVDLFGATAAGLEMNDLKFRQLNRALITHIWPYAKDFGLENPSPKFTGDGWLFFNPDMEKINSFVALAKTLAYCFQRNMAKELRCRTEEIPAIRAAICTGLDEEINFGPNQREWVGDSARRATRAASCCDINEVIVSSLIREAIGRTFRIHRILVGQLPDHRRPKHWEEYDFEIYSVGELLPQFESVIKTLDDPAEYAPNVTYLDYVGRTNQAKQILRSAAETIVSEPELAALQTPNNPAQLARLAEVGSELRKLLYAAPNREMREIVLDRMNRVSVPPPTLVFNSLIAKSPNYSSAVDWFDLMTPNGAIADVITYSTLIHLSPDYATAQKWFDDMRAAGVVPNEIAATAMARKLRTVSEFDRLTTILLDAQVFIGEGYYSAIFGTLAEQLSAEDLLGWFVRQKYKRSLSLAPAIRKYIKMGNLDQALRVSLAFPFLDAARHISRVSGRIDCIFHTIIRGKV